MKLEKFLVFALLLFFLGITALYTGINRVPFRQAEPGSHQTHSHAVLLTQFTNIKISS